MLPPLISASVVRTQPQTACRLSSTEALLAGPGMGQSQRKAMPKNAQTTPQFLLQHPGFSGPHLSPPYCLPPAGCSLPPPGRPPPSRSSSGPLMPSLIRPTTSRLCRCQAALGCASEGLCPRCLPLDRAGILIGPSPLRRWPPPRGVLIPLKLTATP